MQRLLQTLCRCDWRQRCDGANSWKLRLQEKEGRPPTPADGLQHSGALHGAGHLFQRYAKWVSQLAAEVLQSATSLQHFVSYGTPLPSLCSPSSCTAGVQRLRESEHKLSGTSPLPRLSCRERPRILVVRQRFHLLRNATVSLILDRTVTTEVRNSSATQPLPSL